MNDAAERPEIPSLVTIDVEGTLAVDSDHDDPYASVKLLDKFLETARIPVTLFVTPDVVEQRPDTIRGWCRENTTIGLHIHPARLKRGQSDRLSEYDRETIEGFLAAGCESFESYLGMTPTSFRAGRWEYSEQLLAALDAQGFERDASLKPDLDMAPYSRSGIDEYPLTVYSNVLVQKLMRPWDFEGVPMHADAFLGNAFTASGFYCVTWRLIRSNRPYIMVSYHDYDLLRRPIRNRLGRYQRFLARRTEPTTLESFGQGL